MNRCGAVVVKRSGKPSIPRGIGVRELRARPTPAEELLWRAIRGRQLDGVKFRRQHPIDPYVVDFCCLECRLAIELDGSVHETQRDYDAERDRWLRAAGYRVLRFPNDAVLLDLSSILEHILRVEMNHLPR